MKNFDLIYGLHAVKTVVETRPKDIVQLLLSADRHDKRLNIIKELAQKHNVPCETISHSVLEKWVGEGARHQGVIAKCKPLSVWTEKILMDCVENRSTPIVLLILDGVQDPHNLGACLRSANAFGVTAVIAPKDRAASITDVVRKVACGAAEQTPFVAVANLHRTLLQLKEQGIWLVGLDSEAALGLSQVDLKGNVGIVMGGESDGMRRLTKEACDYLAQIPMQGSVESLNVSVATGVTLYEVRRQRK
ncbi:MAG: 23S rRNA (guanosine(2251)-2'-O)-methyltransferase RlmB [Gammaproteobacteria bacterium RIFCSPHIGHO2_12_FULL_38_11]|nr:MAG: 23S rRNA (guanosine(2251)-2'-O)-methyltransferase RlmB [Gammaproteobacteria bacterium RIFCSPHIGHO2_12_FULL_38_11]